MEQWSAVTMAVLALHGEQTLPIFPPANAALAAALPNALVEIIPAANHCWDPPVMADALAGFLHP